MQEGRGRVGGDAMERGDVARHASLRELAGDPAVRATLRPVARRTGRQRVVAADDPSEAEADRIASRVMRTAALGPVATPATGADGRIAPARVSSSPASAGGAVIHRRIAMTSKQLRSTMSTTKIMGAAISNSTLNQLLSALDAYHKNKDPKHDLWYVDIVLALARKYLDGHAADSEGSAGDRRRLVEDLEAQAFAEQGKLKASDVYLKDMKDQSIQQMNPQFTHDASASVAAGKATKAPGANAESVALAKKYGLSEAEILAVKTYSASDYTYINPATANNDAWMKGMFSKSSDGELRTKKLDGALQAGMLMQAFAKMEVKKGTTYRGTRLSPAEFDDQYVKRKTVRFDAFASSALEAKVARDFANGKGKPRPDQTVSVFLEVEVVNGRDLRQLSVFGYSEAEWLLMPGATFTIDRIEDDPQHDVGTPTATAWKKVKLKQTA